MSLHVAGRALAAAVLACSAAGCASGRPLPELLPAGEPHLARVTAGLDGLYRADDPTTQPYGGHTRTWLPIDAPDRTVLPEGVSGWTGRDARPSGGSLSYVQPGSPVAPGETFELGGHVVPDPTVPPLQRVNLALYRASTMPESDPPDTVMSARVRAAIAQPPLAQADVPLDGPTYGWTATLREDDVAWEQGPLGPTARFVLSVIAVDAEGGVGRTLLVLVVSRGAAARR